MQGFLQNVDCCTLLDSKVDLMDYIHYLKKNEIEQNRIENIRVIIILENIFSYRHTHIHSHDVNFLFSFLFLVSKFKRLLIHFKIVLLFFLIE